jgi:hypothetical protein
VDPDTQTTIVAPVKCDIKVERREKLKKRRKILAYPNFKPSAATPGEEKSAGAADCLSAALCTRVGSRT